MCCTGDTNLIFTAAVAMVTVRGLVMVMATAVAVFADAVFRVTVVACICCCFPGGPPAWLSWLISQNFASRPHPLSDSYDKRRNISHSCCCHHGHCRDLPLLMLPSWSPIMGGMVTTIDFNMVTTTAIK
jgi:hypothetical protein